MRPQAHLLAAILQEWRPLCEPGPRHECFQIPPNTWSRTDTRIGAPILTHRAIDRSAVQWKRPTKSWMTARRPQFATYPHESRPGHLTISSPEARIPNGTLRQLGFSRLCDGRLSHGSPMRQRSTKHFLPYVQEQHRCDDVLAELGNEV